MTATTDSGAPPAPQGDTPPAASDAASSAPPSPNVPLPPLLSGISSALGPALLSKVRSCRILLVGAGGIGCELLKNLALSGFRNVDVIDLDTIDVSNLNRQFLFRSHHVGMPKCTVAAAAAGGMAPTNDNGGGGDDDNDGEEAGGVRYVAHHGNVCDNSRFNVQFLSQFALVLNALDNVTARRRVNRLCLAARVPLIEAGTTGYLGQVTVIDKASGVECYECQTKPTQKVYPICTIRSTPSQPVHCIVWAKELYKLLFADKVEESMLYEDPNVGGGGGEVGDDDDDEAEKKDDNDGDGNEENSGPSTYMDLVEELRSMLKPSSDSTDDSDGSSLLLGKASEVLTALYSTEITKQIETGRYRTAQKVPKPVSSDDLAADVSSAPTLRPGYKPTDVWSARDCTAELLRCISDAALTLRSGSSVPPSFDKDDARAMRFVTAASNLRQYVFGIEPVQSLYSAKGIAGNIIPAIATTNAIVAGLQILQVFHVLRAQLENGGTDDDDAGGTLKECCRYTYCLRDKTRRGFYLQPVGLPPPNPKCFVCRSASVDVTLDPGTWTMDMLLRKIVKGTLGFGEPTVLIGGDLVYEEGDGAEDEYACNLPKKLRDLPGGGIGHGTVVRVEDFTQDLEVDLCFTVRTEWEGEKGEEVDFEERFEVGGDKPVAKDGKGGEGKEGSEEAPSKEGADAAEGGEAGAAGKAEGKQDEGGGGDDDDDDDDEIEVFDAPDPTSRDIAKEVEAPPMRNGVSPRKKKKRPLEENGDDGGAPTKKKPSLEGGGAEIEVIELE